MLSVVGPNVVMPNVSKLSVIEMSVEYINAENRYVNVITQCHYAESTYAVSLCRVSGRHRFLVKKRLFRLQIFCSLKPDPEKMKILIETSLAI
jgi:hypothetical protein